MEEKGAAGDVEVTDEVLLDVLMGDGGLVLLSEVLFEGVLLVAAALVLLSAIMFDYGYKAIIIGAMRMR